MQPPRIPQPYVITTDTIPHAAEYQGLRLLRWQSSREDMDNYNQHRYQFQHEPAEYSVVRATLCRKGAEGKYRLIAMVHPTLKVFTELVKYDPAHPPADNYEAQGVRQAHEQTQSDFLGEKKANTLDFKNYLLEGIKGNRTLYLPTVTGWQSTQVFNRTVFVAFDENDPNALYGLLYLPKAPIMQADGQTQTAALFQIAHSAEAQAVNAHSTLLVTLEIELNVGEREAAQSFADRNGRGVKKNRNLVIALDTSSALSDLRVRAAQGTIFERRLSHGGAAETGKNATKYIVDLSTMEQMLLGAVSNDTRKPEHIKHHHVEFLLPYCREFLRLLDTEFGQFWLDPTPPNQDGFRRLFVHGWPFCLKALAQAYYQARIDELGPLAAAIGTEHEDHDGHKTMAQKYMSQVEKKRAQGSHQPVVTLDELIRRLRLIDWHRYRRHWIAITGHALKDGRKKTFKLKGSGQEKVEALAQNTPATIAAVKNKILSNSWESLCSHEDEPLK